MADFPLVVERADYVLDPNRTLNEATRNFFHFWRPPMHVGNRPILEPCFFFDVHVPVYVDSWPQPPGPAHPGVFEDIFPALLGALIGRHNVLTLQIRSSDPDYFDEQTFIRDVLAPRRMAYLLFSNRVDRAWMEELAELKRPLPNPTKIGNLLFERPLDSLQGIVDNWFMCPQVTVEGYSSGQSCLARLAEQYFEPYCEHNIRKVLEVLEFGFKLWRDNNGLLILSDKLNEDAIRNRLATPDLAEVIRSAISAAQHRSPAPGA
jgi:hypothetical protein